MRVSTCVYEKEGKDANQKNDDVEPDISNNDQFSKTDTHAKSSQKRSKAASATSHLDSWDFPIIEVNPNCWLEKRGEFCSRLRKHGLTYPDLLERIIDLAKSNASCPGLIGTLSATCIRSLTFELEVSLSRPNNLFVQVARASACFRKFVISPWYSTCPLYLTTLSTTFSNQGARRRCAMAAKLQETVVGVFKNHEGAARRRKH